MSDTPEITTIKAGQLVMLTSGEYSDYVPQAIGRAMKDFTPAELHEVWAAHQAMIDPNFDIMQSFSNTGFGAWVMQSGFMEEVDCIELHIGSYDWNPAVSDANRREGF